MGKKKALTLAGVLAALFALFGVAVLSGLTVGFDAFVFRAFRGLLSPVATALMIAVSSLGTWFVYVPAAIVLLALPQTRQAVGMPAAAALTLSAGLNVLLKLAYAVGRPGIDPLVVETGYGFPSGHAMNGLAFVGLTCFLYHRYGVNARRKRGLLALGLAFVLMLGVSRVYLGVHSPSDVLGGFLAGGAVLSLALALTPDAREVKAGA